MQDVEQTIADLGNEPPLVADGRKPPDRREVSARWLSGTFLTGITSSVLMGVALFAALDGHEQLATPPEIAAAADLPNADSDGQDAKTARVVQPRQIVRAKDRRRMEVSTVSKVGDQEVIRAMPLMRIKMALAAGYKTGRAYPAYDPLAVVLDDGKAPVQNAGDAPQIYGAKAESDILIKTVDFPLATAAFDEQGDLSGDEVEQAVRNTAAILTDGDVQVAALHYVAPERFGDSLATATLTGAELGFRVMDQNMTVTPRQTSDDEPVYAEDIIPFNVDRRMDEALEGAGYNHDESTQFAARIAGILNGSALRAGSVLRVGLEVRDDVAKIVRVSVYDGVKHILTVALDDKNQIAQGQEPEPNPELLTAFDDSPPVPVRGALPTVYDSVYRAAYSYGMSRDSTRRLVRLLSGEIDLQRLVGRSDRLEVLFSQPDDEDEMSDESQLLYVAATFGGKPRRFYRFQMPDGSVDYFDPAGRNNRQSFLRNPLPNGKFRSGFGGRSDPFLGISRMHTGVDWAAPIGSPIYAVANGVVEKSGWASGYGKQTILQHVGGYETSYNHQSAFARGIQPGVRVRQGQIIGYVGTTGRSTGAHLHYELIVNGTKVDPMRARLPSGGKALDGKQLAEFERERQRIDDLLEDDDGDSLKVASRTGS